MKQIPITRQMLATYSLQAVFLLAWTNRQLDRCPTFDQITRERNPKLGELTRERDARKTL